MKSLDQLIDLEEPALVLINQWLLSAKNDVVLLPPSSDRSEALLNTQVTTRSPIGAIVYETGGVLIDHGWLRLLGSGHPKLTRKLPDWNHHKADQCYFVADDAVGGFFAINGGLFGKDLGKVYYWPPDSFEWEPMEFSYTEFFRWAISGDLEKFYSSTRWSTWKQDVSSLAGDRCFDFYPPLWSKEGAAESSRRATVPAEEAFLVKTDILSQRRMG
jgi:hypothetical protein